MSCAVASQAVTLSGVSLYFGDPDVAVVMVFWRRGSIIDAGAQSGVQLWTPLTTGGVVVPRASGSASSDVRAVPLVLGLSMAPGETVSLWLVPSSMNWVMAGALPWAPICLLFLAVRSGFTFANNSPIRHIQKKKCLVN